MLRSAPPVRRLRTVPPRPPARRIVDHDISQSPDGATLAALRRFLLILLAVSFPGTLAELVLLGHTEDTLQYVPLVLLAVGFLVVVWHWLVPTRLSLRVLQGIMLLFIVSGGVGVFFHFRGNVEWELEGNAGMGGFTLFREAMMGAVPSLAPGTMALLGAIGLLYAFRHPLLGLTDTST